MKKYEDTKNLLMKTLNSIQFNSTKDKNLNPIKNHVKTALNELKNIIKTEEKSKKEAKETEYQTWWKNTTAKTTPTATAKTAEQLKLIDLMIEKEQKTIDDLNKSKKPNLRDIQHELMNG